MWWSVCDHRRSSCDLQCTSRRKSFGYALRDYYCFFFLSKLQSANTNRQRTHRHSRIDNQNWTASSETTEEPFQRKHSHFKPFFSLFLFFSFRKQNGKKGGREKRKVQISNRPVGPTAVGVSKWKAKKGWEFPSWILCCHRLRWNTKRGKKKKKTTGERRSELHVPTHSHPGD